MLSNSDVELWSLPRWCEGVENFGEVARSRGQARQEWAQCPLRDPGEFPASFHCVRTKGTKHHLDTRWGSLPSMEPSSGPSYSPKLWEVWKVNFCCLEFYSVLVEQAAWIRIVVHF